MHRCLVGLWHHRCRELQESSQMGRRTPSCCQTLKEISHSAAYVHWLPWKPWKPEGTQCVLAIVGNKCDLQSQATVCATVMLRACASGSWNRACSVTGTCPQSGCWDICQDQSPDKYICFASFNRGVLMLMLRMAGASMPGTAWFGPRQSWEVFHRCWTHGCFQFLLRLRQSSDMEWRPMGIEINGCFQNRGTPQRMVYNGKTY